MRPATDVSKDSAEEGSSAPTHSDTAEKFTASLLHHPFAKAPGRSAQASYFADSMLCCRLFVPSLFFRAHEKGLGVQNKTPKIKNMQFVRINITFFQHLQARIAFNRKVQLQDTAFFSILKHSPKNN